MEALGDFFFGSLSDLALRSNVAFELVAPILLGFAAWKVWVRYVNAEYMKGMKWQLLEIRLPKEIRRSPLAMELVLNTLHQTGSTGTWYDRYWLGRVRNYFSLEIVSIEGTVHFFIRTPEAFRNFIESYIYAQYSEAEVTEVPDYTERITYAKDGRWSIWGTEFALTAADPYPIKTYVDYGLNETVKEEEKIDPITTTIELMASMQKGEQLWLQIIVRASGKEVKGWKKEAGEEIKKIKDEALKKVGAEKWSEQLLTSGEKDVIKAIERNVDKLPYDVGIRGIYIAEKEAFRGSNIPSLINILKIYNSTNLNGFKLARPTSVDYPWEDFHNIRQDAMKMEMFELYRRRGYFYPPHSRKPFVLSSEELATIYHFPGAVATTPSFGRVDSKKAEPPANLPI